LVHELIHFFTHIEKGFLFTTKQLVLSPGKTVFEFIEGKRKKYFSPVSYFLVWITIYALLLYWFQKVFGENRVIDYQQYFGDKASTEYAITHLALVLTIVIPFQGLYLYLLFTKVRYNYFETIVIAIYCLGTIIFFQLLFALISLGYFSITNIPVSLSISDIFKISYLIWFAFDFVRSVNDTKYKFAKTVVFILLPFGTFTIWRLYGFPYLNHLLHGRF